jgi:phosphatidate cytidylyltransferase
VLAVASVLLAVPLLLATLTALGRIKPEQRRELWARYFSWLVFIPLIIGPVLLGAAYTIAAVAVLSLACYREFARATGLFREHLVSLLVVLGILALTFAIADHWYEFFMALTPLTIATIAAISILPDRPQGYIQRVALGVFAFMLFGVCFGHLGYLANDGNYRAMIIWLVACVELNDVFAYVVGKSLGRHKLAPHTSPNKTIAGSLGALVLTTALAATLGHWVFAGTRIDQPGWLILLGAIVSACGQLGDLALSSIKRDLGIKDWAATFPGHGGLLDRFNSLLFAAPAVFHFVGYLKANGIGLDQQHRIITGG